MLDRSSPSRMCRPLGSNQDVPLFRRMHGPPLPGRRTTALRSVRESNPSRCRDRAVASPDASQTRHRQVGAEGIEPPSRGNRPRALPLDDAPVVLSSWRETRRGRGAFATRPREGLPCRERSGGGWHPKARAQRLALATAIAGIDGIQGRGSQRGAHRRDRLSQFELPLPGECD